MAVHVLLALSLQRCFTRVSHRKVRSPSGSSKNECFPTYLYQCLYQPASHRGNRIAEDKPNLGCAVLSNLKTLNIA